MGRLFPIASPVFTVRSVTIQNRVSVVTSPGAERLLEGPSVLLLSWTTGE